MNELNVNVHLAYSDFLSGVFHRWQVVETFLDVYNRVVLHCSTEMYTYNNCVLTPNLYQSTFPQFS